jgi:hypothetical protein
MRRKLLYTLPFLAACYTYAPIESATVQPGMSVRARISAATAEQIEPLLGTTDARSLSGVVVGNARDTLIMEVPTTAKTLVGRSMQTLKQRVTIPRSAVLELEQSRLDRVRTTAVAGAAAVVLGTVVLRAVIGDPGKEPIPGGGGGPDLRFPVFLRW